MFEIQNLAPPSPPALTQGFRDASCFIYKIEASLFAPKPKLSFLHQREVLTWVHFDHTEAMPGTGRGVSSNLKSLWGRKFMLGLIKEDFS